MKPCWKLDHFVYIDGVNRFSKCCDMTFSRPKFDGFDTMMNSDWLANVKQQFEDDIFPPECIRCEQFESLGQKSNRYLSDEEYANLENQNPNFLVAMGSFDNICNSACFSCSPRSSSMIAVLEGFKNKKVYDTEELLSHLPIDRIVRFNITGGEPSYSKNVKQFLNNIPQNIKEIAISTNGSRYMEELESVLSKGTTVYLCISLDGINEVHDYARWPIKFEDVHNNILRYKKLKDSYQELVELSSWTTVSALNLFDIMNIKEYSKNIDVPNRFSFLVEPAVINVKYKNKFTLYAKEKLLESTEQKIKDLAKHVAIDRNNQEELDTWLQNKELQRGIIDPYYKRIFKENFNND